LAVRAAISGFRQVLIFQKKSLLKKSKGINQG